MSKKKIGITFNTDWDSEVRVADYYIRYRKGNNSKELKDALSYLSSMKKVIDEYNESKVKNKKNKEILDSIREHYIIKTQCIKKDLEELRAEVEEKETNPYPLRNSQTISSVADVREFQRRVRFNQKINSLRDTLKLQLESLEEDDTPELREVNAFMAYKLRELLDVHINDEKTLEYIEWLYNYGKLRTEEEIAARTKTINIANYLQSGSYDSDCFNNNFLFGLVGFVLGFGLIMSSGILWVFRLPLGIFIGGVVWLIAGIISRTININLAKKHNIPINHPSVMKERINRGVFIGSTIGAVAHTVSHAKKSVKDITNVDAWKEMK